MSHGGSRAERWIRPPSLAAVLALAASVVGRAPLFLAGIAAAMLYDRCGPRIRAWTARHGVGARLVGDAVLVSGLVGLVALLEWVTRDPFITREVTWPSWHVAEALLWASILLTLMLLPGFVRPLLVNRVWGFLGVISYSLYLVHLPMLWYGRRYASVFYPGTFAPFPGQPPGWTRPALVATTVLILIAIAGAALSYVAIERPILRLKRRVAG